MFTLTRRHCAALFGTTISVMIAAVAFVPPTAAHADQLQGGRWVKGQIEVTYNALGGADPHRLWGRTLTDELDDRRGGKFQVFESDASIYWNPGADGGNAHAIGGAIRSAWGKTGWETGPLGYPVSDERRVNTAGDPILGWGKEVAGAWNDFQNGGKIMWTPQTGAHPVLGEIGKAFDRAGGVAKYGWPTGPERRTAGGAFTQDFQKGSITWPAAQSGALR